MRERAAAAVLWTLLIASVLYSMCLIVPDKMRHVWETFFEETKYVSCQVVSAMLGQENLLAAFEQEQRREEGEVGELPLSENIWEEYEALDRNQT